MDISGKVTTPYPRWGPQIDHFLSGLGDVKATIMLNLRWDYDCEHFEDEYVGVGGWRCIQDGDVLSWSLPRSVFG